MEGPRETLEERQPDAGVFPYDDPQPPGAAPDSPPGPGFYDTSEFFIGSVSVGVFLMESNGSAYNWSDSEVTQTLNGIYAAMDWWINRGGTAANLSFTYDLHIRQPTTYEPIQRPSADDYLWVGEAMTGLGYPSSYASVRQYLNDLRNANGTDWAYAIFVVDSQLGQSGPLHGRRLRLGLFRGTLAHHVPLQQLGLQLAELLPGRTRSRDRPHLLRDRRVQRLGRGSGIPQRA